MSDQPLDHVRRPDLPWRTSERTECGRPINDVAKWIDRDALLARIKKLGKQRTGLVTCMTCWQTSARWKTFAEDPVDALYREVYGGSPADSHVLRAELRAIAALVDKYRNEFDDYLTGLDQTVNLADRRRRAR
jgi:hypothetical protein